MLINNIYLNLQIFWHLIFLSKLAEGQIVFFFCSNSKKSFHFQFYFCSINESQVASKSALHTLEVTQLNTSPVLLGSNSQLFFTIILCFCNDAQKKPDWFWFQFDFISIQKCKESQRSFVESWKVVKMQSCEEWREGQTSPQ